MTEDHRDIPRQFQGRIILPFFQEDNGLPPHPGLLSQFELGHIVPRPEFLDTVIHF